MVLLQQAKTDAYINNLERLFFMKRTLIGIVFTCVGVFINMICILATAIAMSGVHDFWYILLDVLGLAIPFLVGVFLFLVGILTIFIEYFRKQ